MTTKRMLIDSSHAEETRVVVASGTRLEEFDFETSTRKQLKGNIYLAKVTRVEPSLQAAFVDFGGNRHGFLPFGEIHPDYYQIPLADREALFREQERVAEEAEAKEAANDARAEAEPLASSEPEPETGDHHPEDVLPEEVGGRESALGDDEPPPYQAASPWDEPASAPPIMEGDSEPPSWAAADAAPAPHLSRAPDDDDAMERDREQPSLFDSGTRDENEEPDAPPIGGHMYGDEDHAASGEEFAPASSAGHADAATEPSPSPAPEAEPRERANGGVEEVGGDELGDGERRRSHVSRSLLSRRYKIQAVIKKRQIMLIQVVKEERGTKGAALTTYLSLAGRYCVLMPNAIRGGGISRKIVNAEDRRRLKSITSELEVPGRMGLIVRTAGMNRTKPEIKRDFEYLLRQWEGIRDLTLGSTAPCLIYGEANLIRRSIRDLYSKDIDEVLVEGEEGYRIAKDFMRTLIPSHTAKVQPYRDSVPLFVRHQIESQLDSMYSPQVQLRSGGYLVMNQTEALVAIDVNSGRATKERNIEETAFRTNLEAAEEVARQLRLRDLAGLIVIDFIDMDESRNQRAVERRLKDALKVDRARIQVGRISAFGLLEMSRQRLRPSLAEGSMEKCTACGGTGMLRSTESAALHVLRAIEEEGMRERAAEIRVHVPGRIAMYVLNNKRQALADIEARYGFAVGFLEDNTLVPPGHEIERVRARGEGPTPADVRASHAVTAETTEIPALEDEDVPVVEEREEVAQVSEVASEPTEANGGRRRRRKHGRGFEPAERTPRGRVEAQPADENEAPAFASGVSEPHEIGEPAEAQPIAEATVAAPAVDDEDEAARAARRRRRGRRGGRRRRGGRDGLTPQGETTVAEFHGEEDPPVEAVAPSAKTPGAEESEEHRDRGRRRRRRGGRRGRGDGPQAGGVERASRHAEEPSYGAAQPPAEPESWAGGPPAGGDAIRVDTDAIERPTAEAPRPVPAPEAPRLPIVDEMENGAARFDANERPGESKSETGGPSRRGWWQRVLTGR